MAFTLLFSINAFAGEFYSDAITIDSVDTINLAGQDINIANGVWVSWGWDEGYSGWINDWEVTYANLSSDGYCDLRNDNNYFDGIVRKGTYFQLYGQDGNQCRICIGAYTDDYGSITSYCWKE